jgi:mannitol 2-dehydrogenase
MSVSAAATTSGKVVSVCENNLSELSHVARVPTYDRRSLSSGILHMSVGGFHRSHQAVYLDEYLKTHAENWMITGVGLLDADAPHMAALGSQDMLYTVLERSPEKDAARIVGSMKQVLHAPSNPDRVIAKISDEATRIVSLTVTEKGYYYDEKKDLNFSHPVVQHDLQNPAFPKSAIGYLAAGLARRRGENGKPLTVMCCDNLPENGEVTRKILLQFVSEVDRDLASWISDNISFPNAMVDRITPATTDQVKQILLDQFGIQDQWPVVCEDFIQWVLEDKFVNGRPNLEEVGVQIVKDVHPYEKMKVRLLNGSHSALSYVSYLMGYRDVDAAMADPLIRQFVRNYMDQDITPTLPPVPGIDLAAYKDTLISRFSNHSIRDQVQRLAEDGSQKIHNAIVPPLESQLVSGGSVKWMALALAGWFRYLAGHDENGNAIEIKDPMKDVLMNRARLTPKDPMGLLGVEEIFGTESISNPRIFQEMSACLQSIYTKGMRQTLADMLNA